MTRVGISGTLEGDGIPSLSESSLPLLLVLAAGATVLFTGFLLLAEFMAIVVTLFVVGIMVLSRTSEESSYETEPVDEAADELESTEQTPLLEDDEDSRDELTRGSPIS